MLSIKQSPLPPVANTSSCRSLSSQELCEPGLLVIIVICGVTADVAPSFHRASYSRACYSYQHAQSGPEGCVAGVDHSASYTQDLLQGWDDPVGDECLDLLLEAAVAHLSALILADPVLLHTSLGISDLWVTVCFLQIHH